MDVGLGGETVLTGTATLRVASTPLIAAEVGELLGVSLGDGVGSCANRVTFFARTHGYMRTRAPMHARPRTEGLTTARATGGQEWQSFATVRRKVADVAMLRDAIEWVLRAAGALQSLTMMAALL